MTRPARVTIDPQAAAHNLARVRQCAPNSRVLAVIKADAYGHGITRMAGLFRAADGFAVASLEEATVLRETGIQHPLVLLEGPFEIDELKLIVELGCEVVIHTDEQVRMLQQCGQRLPVWLKFDTGMHRLGFEPHRYPDLRAVLSDIAKPLRVMTHFANAHRRGDSSVEVQLGRFQALQADGQAEASLANSGAILTCPDSHADWVRPGLMLYGVSPLHDETAAALDLQPVMTLRSRLIAVRHVRAGERIGYGGTYICPEDMPVGVVAYGYGDGYPRQGGTGTPILVNGERTQVIGASSMDMMSVDLRPVPNSQFGDPVTLWGRELPVEEVAVASGTIPYELLCRTRMRAHYELVGL